MKNDDFEKQLGRVPMRKIPADWRAEILGTEQGKIAATAKAAPMQSWWRDLLWPCPQAWAALVLIWAGILISNQGTHASRDQSVVAAPPENLMVRLAQEQSLTENQEAGL